MKKSSKKQRKWGFERVLTFLIIIAMMIPFCGATNAMDMICPADKTSIEQAICDLMTTVTTTENPLRLCGEAIVPVKLGSDYTDEGLMYKDEEENEYKVSINMRTGKWTVVNQKGISIKGLEEQFKVIGGPDLKKAGTYLIVYKLGDNWTTRIVVVYYANSDDDSSGDSQNNGSNGGTTPGGEDPGGEDPGGEDPGPGGNDQPPPDDTDNKEVNGGGEEDPSGGGNTPGGEDPGGEDPGPGGNEPPPPDDEENEEINNAG